MRTLTRLTAATGLAAALLAAPLEPATAEVIVQFGTASTHVGRRHVSKHPAHAQQRVGGYRRGQHHSPRQRSGGYGRGQHQRPGGYGRGQHQRPGGYGRGQHQRPGGYGRGRHHAPRQRLGNPRGTPPGARSGNFGRQKPVVPRHRFRRHGHDAWGRFPFSGRQGFRRDGRFPRTLAPKAFAGRGCRLVARRGHDVHGRLIVGQRTVCRDRYGRSFFLGGH